MSMSRFARAARDIMGEKKVRRRRARPLRTPPMNPVIRKRILLLAEHHLIRVGVSMFLEAHGHRVDVSWDETSAIALVEAAAPHAAVLDYCLGMPETLRIADLLASMSIPFLFLTNPLVEASMGAHRGAPSLVKPCSAKMLADGVKNLLRAAS